MASEERPRLPRRAAWQLTAIWLGLCSILKDAQRSNANQTCRNLLLSDKASAFPIPSLEILANDVKCSHGTTVGQVDENLVFYAMTRGIDRGTAQKMIVDGFLEPLIDASPLRACATSSTSCSTSVWRSDLGSGSPSPT